MSKREPKPKSNGNDELVQDAQAPWHIHISSHTHTYTHTTPQERREKVGKQPPTSSLATHIYALPSSIYACTHRQAPRYDHLHRRAHAH